MEKAARNAAPATGPAAEKLRAAQNIDQIADKAAAIAAFEAIVQAFPTSMEAGIARNQLRRLKASMGSGIPKSTPAHGGITPRG